MSWDYILIDEDTILCQQIENRFVEYILSITPNEMKQEVESNLRMKIQDILFDEFEQFVGRRAKRLKTNGVD